MWDKLAKFINEFYMLTKNLSKSDYYKSRNIVMPKPPQRLAPQPPVRLHLLEPLPTLVI